jgi:hypothetical protein
MPRAGGVYSAPPGTAGTPNTTIESAKYNALVDDLVVDANAARPVTAGGIGATTAIAGLDNLSVAGASIASAATVNLANATGQALTVTGTVAITAFGTVAAGAARVLTFAGILTLTHNATSLILPGAANITTAAGDVATFRSKGGGNWICTDYQRASGQPVATTLADAILPARLGVVAKTITDWNTALDNGWYMGSAIANAPAANTTWNIGTVEAHGAAGYRAQTVYDFTAATPANTTIWRRHQAGGVWGAWYKLQWSQAEQDARYRQLSVPLPFTQAFESAQQTLTQGGALTLAHGLGVKPKIISVVLQCTVADAGYSVGDEVFIDPHFAATGSFGMGVSIVPDATNLNVRYGNDAQYIVVLNKGTGGYSTTTKTSWKLVVRAWA